MTNKKILLGILAVALIFGMTLIGCEDEESNHFIGEWSGTFKEKGGQESGATITFTETTWTLKWTSTANETPVTKTLDGTYTTSLGGYAAALNEGGYYAASGFITAIILTINFSEGPNSGSSGSFTSNAITEPFVGKWSGKFKIGEGEEADATITFTNTAWTLAIGEKSETGSYTKTLGITASLAQNSSNIGTALFDPIKENLNVTIFSGESSGSGTFRK